MKPTTMLFTFVTCITFTASALDNTKIEQITGLKGTLNEAEKVFKVTYPRGDLGVAVDKWNIPAFMGLTTWAAFTDGNASATMVMGDFVLMQDEVNPVMSSLLESGLSVTALHNHFFFDEPKAYFMHIAGEGSLEQLAKGVRAGLDKMKEIRASSPQPAKSFGNAIPDKNSITAAPLLAVLGGKPQEKEGMVKFTIGRIAKMSCGCEIGKEMGVNTWAAFAGTDDNAVVDGDFACLEGELQGVLRTLRAGGIHIVAIHHHMTMENPRYIFLHYWGLGKAAELASKLKTALDVQAK
ncbi:DUF1259 domain-containing protein [Prosthecobacter dejongeii]|uniref:DUF1259 domain-containing protein n=1 Tax=Prosthecobacter dejongeii TaxID=48465 RepID=A0A7W7YK17_9BACT|nr:DUF1259 domain-containing protein [Prosthecobacter dejongeii]MBB5037554.1 hypothetical protein [Prosthecobacter dejongeii]